MSASIPVGKYMHAKPIASGWAMCTRHGEVLANVCWLAKWRQYELCAVAEGAGFTHDCLRDLAAFIEAKTAERKGGDRG